MNDPPSSCTSAPGQVPVFTCEALVSGPDDRGRFRAVAAQFPDLTYEGASERDALAQLTHNFKIRIAWHLARNEPIPRAESPLQPQPGDRQRFIPVHL